MKPKKIILSVINIDNLTKEGLIFKWPFAPISYTFPSITSLFTEKYPSNHFTMFSNGAPVKGIETDVFLTEILDAGEYETTAFVSSWVIGKVRKVAVSSGFTIYNDEMSSHELNRLTELIRGEDKTNEL